MATLKRGGRRWVLALVGGIAKRVAHHIQTEAKLRLFASAKEGGTGELRRLLASIKSGGVDEVWSLVSWIGHSESGVIEQECRKREIPVLRFRGLGQAKKHRR